MERMYIDGIDAYGTYKAYPLGYDGLLSWASFKQIQQVEWSDEDGVDADLSDPHLEAQQLTLNIAIGSDLLEVFMEFVYSTPTHTYTFPEIGLTKSLRLVGCSDLSISRRLGMVTLLLSEDSPLQGYEYLAPHSSLNLSHLAGVFFLDNRDITEYGCALLDGARIQFQAYPDVKEALSVGASNINGVIADTLAPVRSMPRQIGISLLLRATTIEEFWQNYNALYYDITRPYARIVEVAGDLPIECYYNSMAVESFSQPRFEGDSVWMQFRITLTTTTPIYALCAESGEVIISENSQNKIATK